MGWTNGVLLTAVRVVDESKCPPCGGHFFKVELNYCQYIYTLIRPT